MLRTITMGTSISIQGIFVRALPNGLMAVRVDDKVYAGTPVSSGK